MEKDLLNTVVELAKSRLLLWRLGAVVVLSVVWHEYMLRFAFMAGMAAGLTKEFGVWAVGAGCVAVAGMTYAVLEAAFERVGTWFLGTRDALRYKRRIRDIKSKIPLLHLREKLLLRCFIDSEQRSLSGRELLHTYIDLTSANGINVGDVLFPTARNALRDQGFLVGTEPGHDTHDATYWVDISTFDILMSDPTLVASLTPARTIPRLTVRP